LGELFPDAKSAVFRHLNRCEFDSTRSRVLTAMKGKAVLAAVDATTVPGM
jgi:hypothetical protein